MTDPAADPRPEQQLPQLDPSMVLTRVQNSGDLGAALVRAASWQLYAEHFAAENAELRQQLSADSGGGHGGDSGGAAT